MALEWRFSRSLIALNRLANVSNFEFYNRTERGKVRSGEASNARARPTILFETAVPGEKSVGQLRQFGFLPRAFSPEAERSLRGPF